VGAVDEYGLIAEFSSYGPSYDGRVKPDVLARGRFTVAQGSDGGIVGVSGTSFSAPVIAGMSACLKQAWPAASAMEMREAVIKSASEYNYPEAQRGYGIPDFAVADSILGNLHGTDEKELISAYYIEQNVLHISVCGEIFGDGSVSIYNASGSMLVRQSFEADWKIPLELKIPLPAENTRSLILIHLRTANKSDIRKIVY
jgi:hypothetical protein